MPLFGGWLVTRLSAPGNNIDLAPDLHRLDGLRVLARRGSRVSCARKKSIRTRALVLHLLPQPRRKFWDTIVTTPPFSTSPIRFLFLRAKKRGR